MQYTYTCPTAVECIRLLGTHKDLLLNTVLTTDPVKCPEIILGVVRGLALAMRLIAAHMTDGQISPETVVSDAKKGALECGCKDLLDERLIVRLREEISSAVAELLKK